MKTACLCQLVLVAFVATGIRAETSAPNTLEAQIEHLEGALAEGFRTKDWQMLELALSGLKSAGVSSPALEQTMLRAERAAALELLQADPRAQIETWGLASRARLGDAKALAALREIARQTMPPAVIPDSKLWKDKPAEAQAKHKDYLAASARLTQRDHAILCLAQLKEKDALQVALGALSSAQHAQTNLCLAAVAADPEGGWKALVGMCMAETGAVERQQSTLTTLAGLALPPQFAMPDAAFRLDAQVAALLPKDAAAQLWPVIASLARRWKPDGANQGGIYTLISTAGRLPKSPAAKDALEALDALKPRLTGPGAPHWQKEIEKLVGKNDQPVKPPKPPDEPAKPQEAAPKAKEDF